MVYFASGLTLPEKDGVRFAIGTLAFIFVVLAPPECRFSSPVVVASMDHFNRCRL